MENKKQFLKAIEEGNQIIRGFRENQKPIKRKFSCDQGNGQRAQKLSLLCFKTK